MPPTAANDATNWRRLAYPHPVVGNAIRYGNGTTSGAPAETRALKPEKLSGPQHTAVADTHGIEGWMRPRQATFALPPGQSPRHLPRIPNGRRMPNIPLPHPLPSIIPSWAKQDQAATPVWGFADGQQRLEKTKRPQASARGFFVGSRRLIGRWRTWCRRRNRCSWRRRPYAHRWRS